MRLRKPLIWIAGIAGAFVLLIALVVLSVPLWFDAEGVKTRVAESISKATGGNTQFERMDVYFLPLPGVTVARPRFSLPERFELAAQSASVDLDLLALIRGRIRLSSVRLVAPKITVTIPEPARDEEPLSIEVAEKAVREVFARIAERAPDIQLIVEDGSVILLASGRQPLSFDNFQLKAEATPDQFEATVSCTSNLWDHLTLKVNLAASDLAGDGTLEMIGLRAHDLGQALGRDEAWPIHEAITDANIQWQIKGLADIQAEGSLSASKVSLRVGEQHVDLLNPTIDASVHLRNGATEISVRQLVLDYPRLHATAKLSRSEAGRFTFQATATNVDLSALQVMTASLEPGVTYLARLPWNIDQGTITSVQVSSESDTLTGLTRPETLHAQLELAGLDAFVPAHDIRVREASGTVSLQAGSMEIRNASARVGKSLLSEGNISASLSSLLTTSDAEKEIQGGAPHSQGREPATKSTKPNAPTREQIELAGKHVAPKFDAKLDLDLAEGLAIAKRVIRDREAQLQLEQLKQLTGRAEFHVSGTMGVQNPEVRLLVSEIQTTAHHAKVPFAIPIHLTRGDLHYVDDALHAQNLEGAIGRSTFKVVSARIGIKAPNALSASKGSAQLALDELKRWAVALPELSKHLDDIEKVTGTLSVSVTKLEGPLRSPEKLRYVLTAAPQQVSIDAPKLGPRFELNGGAIDVSHTRMHLHDITLSTLDTSIQVGGDTSDYRNGLTNFQARINGAAGPEFLDWLRMRADLPDNVQLRNPLQISRLDAKWRRDGEVSARGKVQVNAGPAIGFAMRFAPDHIEIENLSLRDDLSELDAGGTLEGTHFDVRFKGKLVERSLARIFTRLPVQFGELSGDIRASGDWKHPDRTAATGALKGTMIGIPAALLHAIPVPVTVENFSLEGQNQKLLIKTATVAMGDSRLDVSGSIAAVGDQFLLDVDLTSDSFVVPLPTKVSQPKSKATPNDDAVNSDAANSDAVNPDEFEKVDRTLDKMTVRGQKQMTSFESILDRTPGSGRVRINIGKLGIGRRVLTPFIATVSFENKRLVLKLQQARICNIMLTGGLTSTIRGRSDLNVEVRTRGTPIERSVPCLTNQNILMTGLMDINAKLVATAAENEWLSSLHVTYALSARDGVIRKFDALEEVLIAVNETDAADGKLPDIGEASLKYKTISAKGNIDLQTLRFDQIVVDIDGARIVAQGTVDMPTQKISATVLVAPVKTINKIISRMPILGHIFGGNVLAVPVGVSGTIKNPVVVPLSPGAVAGRMVDILTNTLKLPATLLNTTTPDSKKSSPPATGTPGR